MKKKEIILKHGMAKKIADTLGITPQIVYKALRWETNGKKSIAARNMAVVMLEEYNN